MTDSYTGHDPETGCGLMIVVAILTLAVVLIVLDVALVVRLWQP